MVGLFAKVFRVSFEDIAVTLVGSEVYAGKLTIKKQAYWIESYPITFLTPDCLTCKPVVCL